MAEILEGKKFKCAFCKGSGIQPRSLRNRCIACRGKGEVEFNSPVIQCPSCKGSGRAAGSAILSCIACRGIGVIKENAKGSDITEVIGERLGEITKKLQWTRKETEKKTKEIEKRLKPVKPFMKEVEKRLKPIKLFIKEVKKETVWLEKLGDNLKKAWKSLWEQ